MKIIIAGGSGFLGQLLGHQFIAQGHDVVILSRSKNQPAKHFRYVQWNGKDTGDWVKELAGSDVVINLSGKNINCRYTKRNKKLILDSRIESTRIIGTEISKLSTPPKLWLNAAAESIYKYSYDTPRNEDDVEYGTGFLAEVGKKWEEAFFNLKIRGVRQVALRTSVVFGRGEGAFVPLVRLAKFGLGGKQGSGKQMISWMHANDFAKAIDFIINNDAMEGPVNMCSPNPITNSDLMKTIRKAVGAPIGLPAFAWMIKLGARLIQTEAELILSSRYVVPKRLLDTDFSFDYPYFDQAINQLLGK